MKKTSLSSLAQLTGSTLVGDPEHIISSVADLESATVSDASFLSNIKYTPLLSQTKAGVICVDSTVELLEGKNFLISEDPSQTFQKIAKELLEGLRKSGFAGIHATAIIDPSAKIGKDVQIGPYAVVDREAEIGEGTHLYPHTYVGPCTKIGKHCLLYSHASVREHCFLGDRVILQPGAVIGSCGFGYLTDKGGAHKKIEQLGNVIIEDDVEIGANTTIDRARFQTTRIGCGTKIDNLVQIAHNVELGEHNLLAAQTGLAGSTKTGRNVMMGGQVGVVGHLEITDFTMIATRGGVSKSIKRPGPYGGSPAVPLSEHNRAQAHLRKVGDYLKRIKALEKRLSELESLSTS